jgi:hypothetical protein
LKANYSGRKEGRSNCRRTDPDRSGQESGGNHQNCGKGGDISVGLLHESVEFMDGADFSRTEGPIRTAHPGIRDADMASKNNKAINHQSTQEGER